jgi:predicted amidophosphoribosyltransferase
VVPGSLPTVAATAHAGPAAAAVSAYKDAGAHRLGGPLAALLAAAVMAVVDDLPGPPALPIWLVPVPARRGARRARGMDHMRELAGRAARRLRHAGRPANRLDALRHVGPSRDQVGLDRGQRRANVRGTLAAAGPLPPGLLVVVDDVTTTGATLGEAARALRAADPWARLAAATVTWARPTRPAHLHLASPPGHD